MLIQDNILERTLTDVTPHEAEWIDQNLFWGSSFLHGCHRARLVLVCMSSNYSICLFNLHSPSVCPVGLSHLHNPSACAICTSSLPVPSSCPVLSAHPVYLPASLPVQSAFPICPFSLSCSCCMVSGFYDSGVKSYINIMPLLFS